MFEECLAAHAIGVGQQTLQQTEEVHSAERSRRPAGHPRLAGKRDRTAGERTLTFSGQLTDQVLYAESAANSIVTIPVLDLRPNSEPSKKVKLENEPY